MGRRSATAWAPRVCRRRPNLLSLITAPLAVKILVGRLFQADIRAPSGWKVRPTLSPRRTKSMPLLALEPSIYPESLLAEPIAPATTQERWWVLHTRPRAEKALARHCV